MPSCVHLGPIFSSAQLKTEALTGEDTKRSTPTVAVGPRPHCARVSARYVLDSVLQNDQNWPPGERACTCTTLVRRCAVSAGTALVQSSSATLGSGVAATRVARLHVFLESRLDAPSFLGSGHTSIVRLARRVELKRELLRGRLHLLQGLFFEQEGQLEALQRCRQVERTSAQLDPKFTLA